MGGGGGGGALVCVHVHVNLHLPLFLWWVQLQLHNKFLVCLKADEFVRKSNHLYLRAKGQWEKLIVGRGMTIITGC